MKTGLGFSLYKQNFLPFYCLKLYFYIQVKYLKCLFRKLLTSIMDKKNEKLFNEMSL